MDLHDRNFPYPVLCEWSGDYTDGSSFDVALEPVIKNGDCFVSFTPQLNNEPLRQLIQDGKAAVYCNMECSETAYRKSHPLELDKTTEIQFKQGILKGKVEFCPAIVSLEAIPDYRNSFDEDYGDSVHIEAGLLLAIGRQSQINIEVSNTHLAFIPSVFMLAPLGDTASSKFEVNLADEQIHVRIAKPLYGQYMGLNSSFQNKELLTSIIFAPVLVMVLSKCQVLAEQDEPDFGEFENWQWFRAINAKVKELYVKDMTEKELYTTNTNVLEIANKLLGYPVDGAFETLLNKEDD